MASVRAVAVSLVTWIIIGVVSGHPGHSPCTSEGRFADPEDCSKYVICRRTPDGTFTHQHMNCRGYFSPEHGTCVDDGEVLNCKTNRGSRQYSENKYGVDVSSYNCTEPGFFCFDCQTTVLCTNGEPQFELKCDAGDTCQQPASFKGSSICYDAESEPGDCGCKEDDSYIQDPYNEQQYSYCLKADDPPHFKECLGDMVFDVAMRTCVNSNGAPMCETAGRFPNPSDCAKYYNCIPVTSGRFDQIFHNCTEGELFNEQAQDCSDPCLWPNPNFECTLEGRFGDPKSCQHYYVCTENPRGSGTLLQKRRSCPEGTHWDVNALGGLGHCELIDRITTPCIEAQEGRCSIPEYCFGEVDEEEEGSGDAPGQSGNAPGQSGDAPGQSGDAPGQSGDAPGQAGSDDGGELDPVRRRGFVPKNQDILNRIASNLLN